MLALLRRILALLRRLRPSAPDVALLRGGSADATGARTADIASPRTSAHFAPDLPDAVAAMPPACSGEGDSGFGVGGLVDGTEHTEPVAFVEPDTSEQALQSSQRVLWRDGTDEESPIDLGSAIKAAADETSDAKRSGERPEQVLADALSLEEVGSPPTENGAPRSSGCDDLAVEIVAETVVRKKASLNQSARLAVYEPITSLSGKVDAATGDAPAAAVEATVAADPKHADGPLEIAANQSADRSNVTEDAADCVEAAAEDQIAVDGVDGVAADSVDAELGRAIDGSAVHPEPSDTAPSNFKGDSAHGNAGRVTDMINEGVKGGGSPSSSLAEAEAAVGIGETPRQQGEGSCANTVVASASGPKDDLAVNAVEAALSGYDVDTTVPRDTSSDAVLVGTASDASADAVRRKPGEYRPRLSRARERRTTNAVPTGKSDIESLGADLQLLVGAAEWGVELSALLRMPTGAAYGVAVEHGGDELWLGQLDDELLEPLALTDASTALGEPLLVTAVGLPVRWSRTSRDLHVFGPDHRVAGFVSQARVVIGQENVVICREDLADAVRTQILATGSTGPVRIEGPNVPEDWVCWRGVRPVRPSLPVGGQSILDALDPLPAVSIDFSGGIQLSRGVWLEGHPPSVRLLGLLSESDPVLIDGQPASLDGDGAWIAQGSDAPGVHSVDHGGKSAGYTVEAGAKNWDWWPAWDGATHLAGALSDDGGGEFFHVGGSALLVGACPGQICGFARSAYGVGVARPDFEPVWLLTAGSGMRRGTASSVGLFPPPGAPTGSQVAVDRWARAICSSGRAGAERSAERVAWNRYVAAARSWRKRGR